MNVICVFIVSFEQCILTGQVKKCGMLKITHDRYKSSPKNVSPLVLEFLNSFDNAMEHNKEIESMVNKTQVETTKMFIVYITRIPFC